MSRSSLAAYFAPTALERDETPRDLDTARDICLMTRSMSRESRDTGWGVTLGPRDRGRGTRYSWSLSLTS